MWSASRSVIFACYFAAQIFLCLGKNFPKFSCRAGMFFLDLGLMN